MMQAPQQFNIHFPSSETKVAVGSGFLFEPSTYDSLDISDQAMVVTSEPIAQHYLKPLLAALNKKSELKQIDVCLIDDGEPNKNYASCEKVFNALIEKQHYRDTTLFALGGGVVGDLTGFCASTYLRGVNLVQCPTTLLAQVDASIGGKTAINHPLGKNLIGSFYQPMAVLSDVSVLQTLPHREYLAGVAEVLKYGLAFDENFFTFLEKNQISILNKECNYLSDMVRRSAKIKAEVVSQDEQEAGKRVLLNFGHTTAHAIESLTCYSRYLHGEAVAIGVLTACHISQVLGLIDGQLTHRAQELLENLGLPTRIPESLTSTAMLESMRFDKKNRKSCTQWVLLNGLGRAELKQNVPETLIKEVLVKLGAQP